MLGRRCHQRGRHPQRQALGRRQALIGRHPCSLQVAELARKLQEALDLVTGRRPHAVRHHLRHPVITELIEQLLHRHLDAPDHDLPTVLLSLDLKLECQASGAGRDHVDGEGKGVVPPRTCVAIAVDRATLLLLVALVATEEGGDDVRVNLTAKEDGVSILSVLDPDLLHHQELARHVYLEEDLQRTRDGEEDEDRNRQLVGKGLSISSGEK